MANATLRGKRSYAVGFTTSSVQVLPVLGGLEAHPTIDF